MRPPRRLRKTTKTVKTTALSKPSGTRGERDHSSSPASPGLHGHSVGSPEAPSNASSSLVVAQFVVAYIRPRAAAAPLSAELRAALRLKVVSADALLYSSHQSTPRHSGRGGGGSSNENTPNSFRLPPCGPSCGSTPGLRALSGHVSAHGEAPFGDAGSPLLPFTSITHASMTTAPFFSSITGRHMSHTDTQAPSPEATHSAAKTARGQKDRPRVVDHWKEVLELEVVGAFCPVSTKDRVSGTAAAEASRRTTSKTTPTAHTHDDLLSSSFSSFDEEMTAVAATPTQKPRKRLATPSTTQKRSDAMRGTKPVSSSSLPASQSYRRPPDALTSPTRAGKSHPSPTASTPTTGGASTAALTHTKTKRKWRQRVLNWFLPEKSSAAASTNESSGTRGTATRSTTPTVARHRDATDACGSQPTPPVPPREKDVRHATQSAHATAPTPRVSGTPGSTSDLNFLHRTATVSPSDPAPHASAASPDATKPTTFTFPPAQRWVTLRLRCRHQRHLFQLLHNYVVQCRRARVEIEEQLLAEQRHRDAICSIHATPTQAPLLSVSAPAPGPPDHLSSPPTLTATHRSAATNWMLKCPTVPLIDWVPYVEHLSDPRNDLRFGRIPPFLWYALSRWSTTALYAFERGFLVLSHQNYATRLTREALTRANYKDASTFRLPRARSLPTRREPAPRTNAAAVLAPVHGVTSKPSHGAASSHHHGGPLLDTVTLIVSPAIPFAASRSERSTPSSPRNVLSKPTSPRIVRDVGAAGTVRVAAKEPAPTRVASPADRSDVCTSFRDCFMVLLDTHVVFIDSFGDVKFHCSMGELELVTYSQVCERPTTSTGDANAKEHTHPREPDVPPFYPFLCLHSKGGPDEDEEPPLCATFTFLPLMPPSILTNVDDPMGPALGSPLALGMDADGDDSPFGLIPSETQRSGATADANFAAHYAFDDEHHTPKNAASAVDLQWHQHGRLCHRQAAFLDAFLTLTSRTIVSETLDEYLRGGAPHESPTSPLGVMSPLRGQRLMHDDVRTPRVPALHMVELSEKDLKMVLPSSPHPAVGSPPRPPPLAPPNAEQSGGSAKRRVRPVHVGPIEPLTEHPLPTFLPPTPGTEESIEVLPLSLRLARHPLPLSLEKNDLFLRPIGADDDDDDGVAPTQRAWAKAPFSPDGGLFTPQAPQKRRSQLRKGAESGSS